MTKKIVAPCIKAERKNLKSVYPSNYNPAKKRLRRKPNRVGYLFGKYDGNGKSSEIIFDVVDGHYLRMTTVDLHSISARFVSDIMSIREIQEVISMRNPS